MLTKELFAKMIADCQATAKAQPGADEVVTFTRGDLDALHALILRVADDQAQRGVERILKLVAPPMAEAIRTMVDGRLKKRRALCWRGPFDPGAQFEAGDLVQMRRQLYVAQRDAPEGNPGESVDWRMLLD